MLSKQEWNNLQQLSYNVMPEWWWDRNKRAAHYQAYVDGCNEWKEKENKTWGSPSVDME